MSDQLGVCRNLDVIRSGFSNSESDYRGGYPTLNLIISGMSNHLGVSQTLHVTKSGVSYLDRDYLGGGLTLDVIRSGVSDTYMVVEVSDADILLLSISGVSDPIFNHLGCVQHWRW